MGQSFWRQLRLSVVSLPVCIFLLCVTLPAAAAPVPDDDPVFRNALGSLELAAGGRTNVTLQRAPVSGLVSAVVLGRGAGIPVAGSTPAERATAFLRDYGVLFGLKSAAEAQVLAVSAADEAGLQRVKMQQFVNGVPVTGTQITLHLRGAAVARVFAKVSARAGATDTTPALTADQALVKAREVASRYLPAGEVKLTRPRLEVLDRELLENRRTFPPRATWFVEAYSGGIREYIWVDAQRGAIHLRFTQTPHARNRSIYDANGTNVLPGTLVRSEGGAATGDLDADAAYLHAGQTYDYFNLQHGRDSYNGAGAALISTVDFCDGGCPYANAFWNGAQMVYGGGFSRADDVVAHELTHAVTEYSAGLLYFMQSGALNESYSDIFGETVDLTNGTGTDTAGARWSMGEDVPGGAIRNMMNPGLFGDPARVGDPNFWCGSGDNGGVHINSGVPNHAYALMADGGSYNGYVVSPIGLTKAGKIAYRTLNTYLGQASNFSDAYRATMASCSDLEGLYGITSADCAEVQDALDAVEMNEALPCSDIPNEAVPMCEIGTAVEGFADGFEVLNSGDWTTTTLSGLNHWNGGAGTPDLYWSVFPYEGNWSLWGFGYDSLGDSVVTMTDPIAVQPGMKMQFDHAFELEYGYDAGFIEYSTDGANWYDAGAFIDAGTGYIDIIDIGRAGFTGSTRGYTATQLDLSPLAGTNARFRFRVYTDSIVGATGWFVDNVRFYRCLPELRGETITVNEKDSGTGTAQMKIRLPYPSADTVLVDWFTVNGTATAGSDYIAANGTLQFNPGELVKTVEVQTIGDTTDEPDEYFLVNLTNASNAALRLGGLVNIRDNDAVGLSVSDASVMELNSTTVSVNFTISLDQATSQTVTVDLATANGTATAPADYTARTLTLTFSPGQTSRLVSVSVPGDLIDELDEIFYLNATNATNAAIVDGQGVGTITDNDTNITVTNSAVVEPDTGTVDAIFTVNLSSVSTVPVSVNIATANVSAAAGLDYTARTFTLTFNPGQTSRTFAISILGDTLQEANETFNVNLSSPVSGTITDGQGVCTITDNDQPKISIGDASTTEGNSGTKLLSFTLSLSQSSSQTITVGWATAASSATAGSDYASATGTVTFSPGQVSRTVGVNLVGDTADEVNEVFFVNLSSPVNGIILDGQGTGTIVDDDGPVISIGDASVTERDDGTNNMVFTISLSAASPQTVNVSYYTGNGTATAPADYVAKTATIVAFSPGVTSRIVAVVVNGDTVDEPNETFNAFLTNASGGTIGDGTGIGTIIDQDPPRLSVADVSVTETDTTNGTVSVTLSLSSAHSSEVSVTATTANGTAIAGSDYTTRSVAILFAPGQTTRTVSITILPDLVDEPNETFLVNLSAPSNATITDGQAVVTILDND